MNKTLIALCAALSCFVGIGCNGSVTIDENPASVENGGWTTATTAPTTSTETASTTETVTTTTESPVETVELVVTQHPIDGDLTAATEHLLEFDLFAPNHSVRVDSLPYTIYSTDGSGMVKGMGGGFFTSNLIMDVVDGFVYAGPLEIDAPNGAKFANIVLTDSFVIAKGETLQMTYRSALAWNKPGDTEFAGHEYRIDFHVDEITGVIVENGKPLVGGTSSLQKTWGSPSISPASEGAPLSLVSSSRSVMHSQDGAFLLWYTAGKDRNYYFLYI